MLVIEAEGAHHKLPFAAALRFKVSGREVSQLMADDKVIDSMLAASHETSTTAN